eukprot:167783-Alexandrium_andersonii.AAC.1
MTVVARRHDGRQAAGSGWVPSPPRGQKPNAGGGQLVGRFATGSSRPHCASAGPSRCARLVEAARH